MNSFTKLVNNIKSADWSSSNQVFSQIMQQKVADRLAVEKKTIFKEADEHACAYCKGNGASVQPGGEWLCAGCVKDIGREKRPRAGVREDADDDDKCDQCGHRPAYTTRKGATLCRDCSREFGEAVETKRRVKCGNRRCNTSFMTSEDEPSCPKCGAGYEDIED